jgi:hypothetical protein
MQYPQAISTKEEDQKLARALINIPEEYRCFQVATGNWNLTENVLLLGVKAIFLVGHLYLYFQKQQRVLSFIWGPVTLVPTLLKLVDRLCRDKAEDYFLNTNK